MKRFALFIFLIGVICVIFSSCKGAKWNKSEIGYLAYDVNKASGYTVYIKEQSQYQPYLVLTNDYNGNTLLLRERLLPQQVKINDYYSYYENSKMDKFLNDIFLNSLSEGMKNNIAASNIDITKEECLGIEGTGSKTIHRKVFLLSATEAGITKLSYINREGNTLGYFYDSERQIANDENNRPSSWFLRTPDTNYESATFSFGPHAVFGSENSSNENGVRPAFCVSSSSAVKISNTAIDGKSVYVFPCDS